MNPSPSAVSSSAALAALRRIKQAALVWQLSPQARRVLADGLTYLSVHKLYAIERAVRRADRRGVPGDFVECGVALGGSAIVLSSLLSPQRRFRGYDVFEMIPPPGPNDEHDAHARYEVIKSGTSPGIRGQPYYGYMANLRDVVVENFKHHHLVVDGERICLQRGLFADTLHFTPDTRIALAHIDCDWYEPVRLCLERIHPQLAVDGCMILDDYNNYEGCRKATDEFLRGKTDLVLVASKPNALIRRVH